MVILSNAPDGEFIASLRRAATTNRWAGTALLLDITGPSVHPYILQRRALYLTDSTAQTHPQIFADISGILTPTNSPDGQSVTIPSESGPFVLLWPFPDAQTQPQVGPRSRTTSHRSPSPPPHRAPSCALPSAGPPSPDDTIPSDDDRQQSDPPSAPGPAGRLVILSDASDTEIIASLRRVSDTINNAATVGLVAITGPAANEYIIPRRAVYFPGSTAQTHAQIFADLARILPP